MFPSRHDNRKNRIYQEASPLMHQNMQQPLHIPSTPLSDDEPIRFDHDKCEANLLADLIKHFWRISWCSILVLSCSQYKSDATDFVKISFLLFVDSLVTQTASVHYFIFVIHIKYYHYYNLTFYHTYSNYYTTPQRRYLMERKTITTPMANERKDTLR